MQPFRGILVATALLAATVPSGCSRPREPAPRSTASSAPSGPAPSAALADTGSPADAGRAAPVGPTFACGSQACAIGEEICCQVMNVEQVGSAPLRTQCIPSASKGGCDALFQGTDAGLGALTRECADSSGCSDGKVCCENPMGSDGWTEARCVVPTPGLRFPCAEREICTPEGSCRAPRTHCQDGECVMIEPRPSHPVLCGARACPKATPVCCMAAGIGSAKCVKADACGTGEDITCRRGADCAEGEYCGTVPLGGSLCMHREQVGYSGAWCSVAADCDAFCKRRGRGPGRCEGSGWERACACAPAGP